MTFGGPFISVEVCFIVRRSPPHSHKVLQNSTISPTSHLAITILNWRLVLWR